MANAISGPWPVSHPLGGLRGRGQNSTFKEQCHVAYQIKVKHECRSMVANILLPPPTLVPRPTLEVGIKISKFFFFRTWSWCISNLKQSLMQQHGRNYFARRPPPRIRNGLNISKSHFFINMVILHIKFIGITKCSKMVANIWPPAPPPPLP